MTNMNACDSIWKQNKSDKEQIKSFWLTLSETQRRSLVILEKNQVLARIKQQQKAACSCSVCGRKRSVIEEELESLYDAYYNELEAFASSGAGKKTRQGHDDSLVEFGSSLLVKGGILTVADDFLENGGKKFLDLMDSLAEKKEADYARGGGDEEEDYAGSDDDDDYNDYDDSDNESLAVSEEQRMEEGRRMFQIFAAKMFEQRIWAAYREKVAQECEEQLIKELDAEEKARVARELKKEKIKEKKKAQKRAQKQAKDEERRRLEAEKIEEEERRRAEKEQKAEEERIKRQQKLEAERAKKEAERVKREEAARKHREAEERKREAEERKREAERLKKEEAARKAKKAEEAAREKAKRAEAAKNAEKAARAAEKARAKAAMEAQTAEQERERERILLERRLLAQTELMAQELAQKQERAARSVPPQPFYPLYTPPTYYPQSPQIPSPPIIQPPVYHNQQTRPFVGVIGGQRPPTTPDTEINDLHLRMIERLVCDEAATDSSASSSLFGVDWSKNAHVGSAIWK